MSDIVICMLNSQYIHSSLAPWCILAGVKKYCGKKYITSVIESNINYDMVRLCEEISDEKPSVVGLCCYIWNIDNVRLLGEMVKDRLPGCTIVLGGPEVSYNAEQVLSENDAVDFVLSGEGERSFAMLCDKVLHGNFSGLTEVPGICMRTEDGIYVSEANIEDGQPVSPYTEEYFEALSGKIAYIESSRGCPFSCAFCLSGRCGSVRFFDVERTKKEILRLANSGTKTIKFVDRTFNANKKRAVEIWNFIKEHYGSDIPERVCVHFEIGADLLDDECLDVLSGMPKGSIQLEAGIQSFNEHTLEAINRKTNLDRLCNNIKRLVSFKNMHIHIDLIAGLPFEDITSFERSFNKAFSLGSNMLQLGFLKLLHGASMRVERDRYPCEYSKDAPYEVLSTPWLTGDDIKKLKIVEAVNDRVANSGRFYHSLEYVLSVIPCSPFEIFMRFGEFLGDTITKSVPLFEFSKMYYDFFASFEQVDKDVLEDKMICDFFSHSRYGKLPSFLKRQNPKIKRVLEYLAENPETMKKDNAVRAVAILKSMNKAVYCDSGVSKEDDILFMDNGRYVVRFVDLIFVETGDK